MSIFLQRFMRILTPGLIIIVLAAFTFGDWAKVTDALLSGKISSSDITVYLVCVLIVGFLNHEFLRPQIMNPIWREIDLNLKRRMLRAAGIPPQDAVKVFSSEKRLIRTFFTIIDSNSTLANSSDKVRFNGYILTSAVDVEVLFMLFAVLNLFLLRIHHEPLKILFVLVLFGVAFIGKKMEGYFKQKHVQLGNEQLDEILLHHRGEFDKRLHEHFLS